MAKYIVLGLFCIAAIAVWIIGRISDNKTLKMIMAGVSVVLLIGVIICTVFVFKGDKTAPDGKTQNPTENVSGKQGKDNKKDTTETTAETTTEITTETTTEITTETTEPETVSDTEYTTPLFGADSEGTNYSDSWNAALTDEYANQPNIG